MVNSAFLLGFLKGAGGYPADIQHLMAQVESQKKLKADRIKASEGRDRRVGQVAMAATALGALAGGVHAWRRRAPLVNIGKGLANTLLEAHLPRVAREVAEQMGKAGSDSDDELRRMLKAKVRSPKQLATDERRSGGVGGSIVKGVALSGVGAGLGFLGGSVATGLGVVGREVARVPGFLGGFREELIRRAKEVAAEKAGPIPGKASPFKVVPQKLLQWAGKAAR